MKKAKRKLDNILGEGDLQAIGDLVGGLMDKQVAILATKKDLKDEISSLEIRLNNRMDEGFEAVIGGIDTIADKLAEKERVENLEKWAFKSGYKN